MLGGTTPQNFFVTNRDTCLQRDPIAAHNDALDVRQHNLDVLHKIVGKGNVHCAHQIGPLEKVAKIP